MADSASARATVLHWLHWCWDESTTVMRLNMFSLMTSLLITVISHSLVFGECLFFPTNFAGQTKLFRGTIQTKIKHTFPSEVCRRVVFYTQPSPATVINHSHVWSYSRTSLDKSILRPAHQIANRWCQVRAFVNTTSSMSWYRWNISPQVVTVLPTGRKFGRIKKWGLKKNKSGRKYLRLNCFFYIQMNIEICCIDEQISL